MTPEEQQHLSEQLSAYLDGELSDDERQHVERVLAEDEWARRRLAELKATAEHVAALPRGQAPADLFEHIAARMERKALLDEGETAVDVSAPLPRRPVRWLASAAVILLAVSAGYLTLRHVGPGDESLPHETGQKLADARKQQDQELAPMVAGSAARESATQKEQAADEQLARVPKPNVTNGSAATGQFAAAPSDKNVTPALAEVEEKGAIKESTDRGSTLEALGHLVAKTVPPKGPPQERTAELEGSSVLAMTQQPVVGNESPGVSFGMPERLEIDLVYASPAERDKALAMMTDRFAAMADNVRGYARRAEGRIQNGDAVAASQTARRGWQGGNGGIANVRMQRDVTASSDSVREALLSIESTMADAPPSQVHLNPIAERWAADVDSALATAETRQAVQIAGTRPVADLLDRSAVAGAGERRAMTKAEPSAAEAPRLRRQSTAAVSPSAQPQPVHSMEEAGNVCLKAIHQPHPTTVHQAPTTTTQAAMPTTQDVDFAGAGEPASIRIVLRLVDNTPPTTQTTQPAP